MLLPHPFHKRVDKQFFCYQNPFATFQIIEAKRTYSHVISFSGTRRAYYLPAFITENKFCCEFRTALTLTSNIFWLMRYNSLSYWCFIALTGNYTPFIHENPMLLVSNSKRTVFPEKCGFILPDSLAWVIVTHWQFSPEEYSFYK